MSRRGLAVLVVIAAYAAETNVARGRLAAPVVGLSLRVSSAEKSGVKRLTPLVSAKLTTAGSLKIWFRFTLDHVPQEDGFLVQEIDDFQDEKPEPVKYHYWEAWFIPKPKDGEPLPFVEDHWDRPVSHTDVGKAYIHSKIKFYYKKTTGDLGDYRFPPAKPDPETGWKPGDRKSWSLDLPWTDKKPDWWKKPSENGEEEKWINAGREWEYSRIGRISTAVNTITLTPEGLMLP